MPLLLPPCFGRGPGRGDATPDPPGRRRRERIINNMAKFGVDLDHETIYRLITSRDYVRPDCPFPARRSPDPGRPPAGTWSAASPLPVRKPHPTPSLTRKMWRHISNLLRNPMPTRISPTRQPEFPGFLMPLTNVRPDGPTQYAPQTGPCLSDPSSLFPDPCLSEPEEMRDTCGTDAGQTSPRSENI